jgi:hypothetical protein
MPFDRTQPYATASGGGGEWYIQDGQAYSLNGAAIDAPVVPATRNQATGPFTGLSDVPNSYSGQGGKSVTVKESEDGIEFTAGGGGGASAFTDLTDAPATIVSGAMLVPNEAGDALEFTYFPSIIGALVYGQSATGFYANSYSDGESSDPSCYASIRTSRYADGDINQGTVLVAASTETLSTNFQMQAITGLIAPTGLVKLVKDSASEFGMVNFDVVASDATARLTVNAAEYSVAKAIKVKIGNDTYFWPLFGPVA